MRFEQGLVMVVTPNYTTIYEDGVRISPVLQRDEQWGNSVPGRSFRVITLAEQPLHDDILMLDIPEGTNALELQSPSAVTDKA